MSCAAFFGGWWWIPAYLTTSIATALLIGPHLKRISTTHPHPQEGAHQ